MGCWPLACCHSPGTSITFDPNSMAETVGERVAVSRVVNDLPRCDIDAGSRRVLAHLVDGLSLGFEHYIPHLGPVRRSMTVKAVKHALSFSSISAGATTPLAGFCRKGGKNVRLISDE